MALERLAGGIQELKLHPAHVVGRLVVVADHDAENDRIAGLGAGERDVLIDAGVLLTGLEGPGEITAVLGVVAAFAFCSAPFAVG